MADTTPLGEAMTSKDFWRGMIDGDGSIQNHKRYLSVTISLVGRLGINEAYAVFVLKLLGTLPLIKRNTDGRGVCKTVLSGDNARDMLHHLYSDSPKEARLDRKYKIVFDVISSAYQPTRILPVTS